MTSIGPTHAEFVLACIAAGKPVMCEKPLAPTMPECEAILDAEVASRRAARHRRLHAPLRPRLPPGQGRPRGRRDRRAADVPQRAPQRDRRRGLHELHDDDRLDDPRGGRRPAGSWARRSPRSRSSRRSARRWPSRISRTRSSRCSPRSPGSSRPSSSSPTASTATTSGASSSGSLGTRVAWSTRPSPATTLAGQDRVPVPTDWRERFGHGLHGRAPGLDQRPGARRDRRARAPGRATRRPRSSRSASRR